MTRLLVFCLSILMIAGCSIPKREGALPPIKSPDTSSQVFLKNDFPPGPDIYQLTFTLNNKPIYRFGDSRQFQFYLDSGDYMLGYTRGSENCETSIYIKPRGNYVFELGPECRIELISE